MEDRKSKHLKSSQRRIERSAWVPLCKQPKSIVNPEVQDAAIVALQSHNPMRNATRRTNRFFLLRLHSVGRSIAAPTTTRPQQSASEDGARPSSMPRRWKTKSGHPSAT
jgi:hypothetical protein